MYLHSLPIPSQRLKISDNDTTPDFLSSKLAAGTGVSLTVNNDGANETLTVANTDTGSAAVSLHLSSFSHAPLSATAFTAGSVLFSNGTTITQNNSNLFWDNTNKRLGIGTETPTANTFNATSTVIQVYNPTVGTGVEAVLRLNVGATGVGADRGGFISYDSSHYLTLASLENINGKIRFLVDNSKIQAMTIDNAGNVGINATAPARRLDILDTTNPQLRLTHTAGSVYGEVQALSTGITAFTTTGNAFTMTGATLALGKSVETATKNRQTQYLLDGTDPVLVRQTEYWDGAAFATDFGYGFGRNALYQNTGASSNGFGYSALYLNTGASSNGFGYSALYQNTGASSNGFGRNALYQNTGASSNGFGYVALYLNTGASSNGFGYASLGRNNWANAIAIGNQSTTYFQENAASTKTFTEAAINATAKTITISAHGFGSNSKINLKFKVVSGTAPGGLTNNTIYQFTINDANTLYYSGITSVGSGTFSLTNSVDITNTVVIGHETNATKANQVVLGNSSITETLLRGNVGINCTPYRKLDILDSSTSQLRLSHTEGSVYGELQINSLGQLSLLPTGQKVLINASYVAPTLANEVATKQYVDDAIILQIADEWEVSYLGPNYEMSITFDDTLGGIIKTDELSQYDLIVKTGSGKSLVIEDGLIALKEVTTPSSTADYGKIYTKSDNKLYFQDGSGIEHEIQLVA